MNRLFSGFLLACLLAVNTAFAGGFQVSLQGQKQIGMAHAGVGLAMDASALFFNPGSMAFTPQSSVHVGASGILARIAYREPAPGAYTTTNEPGLSTPFAAYGNWNIRYTNEHHFSVGAGIYTPFGSRVLYDDNWKGQFMLREMDLRTFFIQPTLSYRYKDVFGVGAGVVVAPGSVKLRKAIPAQFNDGTYGEATLSGTGTGYGFNVGVFYKLNDRLSFGLNHRSSVAFKSDGGSAEFSVPDDLREFFPNTTFSTEVILPSTTTLGTGIKATDKLTIAFDVVYVKWSVYDTLAFDFVDNTENLVDQASPREYKNAFLFRLGAQYAINPKFQVRGGVYFDQSPVSDGYITAETPDANKINFTTGLSYRIGNYFQVDASFLWVEGFKRTSYNTEMGFSGTWKARAFVPGIGLNVLFPEKKGDVPEVIE